MRKIVLSAIVASSLAIVGMQAAPYNIDVKSFSD